jgi:hypothetical protein
VDGAICEFLRENVGERRWSCSLRVELGSWDKVYEDERYIEKILPMYIRKDATTRKCGEWPGPNTTCGECGLSG